MKSIFIFFISFIIITGCNQHYIPYEGLQPEDQAWINFDIEEFKKNIDPERIPTYTYELENGIKVFESFQFDTFRVYVHYPDTFISRSYLYHPNGKLAFVNSYFKNGGFDIGKGYKYDRKGRLIEIVDFDEPFTYSFEDISEFIDKKDFFGYDLRRTTNGFEEYPHKGGLWKLRGTKNMTQTTSIIDGKTGEILQKDSMYLIH